MNIDIDAELRIEGIARDILRAIQNKRKDENFDISDKINIKIYGEHIIEETIEKYGNYITSNSLAEKIEFVKIDEDLVKISDDLSMKSLKAKLNENLIISGSSCSDKKVSDFAMENGIEGFEFLSCIPGSIGGGIRMNAGCYGKEFKDIIVSVQAIDFDGNVSTISSSNISFKYRSTNLPKDLIFLSGTLKGNLSKREKIKSKIEELKNKKELSQPLRVKTGGSTFKNPIDQSNKKVWELIKESVDINEANKMFGDAKLSEKHCNFLINQGKASSKDMKNLINFIKENVYKNTGVNLELEIILTS